MRKLILTASIIAFAAGPALAQTPPSSTADQPAASGQGEKSEKMTPGTTGAMQNSTGGVATSPQDVQKQGGMGVGTQGDSGKAGKEMGGGAGEKPK